MEVCLSENLHQPVGTQKKKNTQVSFMSYLDIHTPLYEVVQDKYPDYTKEQLEPFLTLSFKKESILLPFVAFCQLAKQRLAQSRDNM